MEQFYGTWKINPAENSGFEELGKCTGMTAEQVTAINKREFTMLIEEKDGGSHRICVDYGAAKDDIVFKLGVPQDYQGLDGAKSKLTVLLQDKMLVEKFLQEDGSTYSVCSHIEGNDLLVSETTFAKYPSVKVINKIYRC
ncbi:uncharacterized protein LOC101863112 [Aplysia californica]|uniref:Uncharacterized protein LOC101863112 n=1 Tax=Aplysia californica TaxID=6500 RepID=A0ABM0JTF3_APLCA|nr:uncharacterized protein LOC101863112 [Aplysia californica]